MVYWVATESPLRQRGTYSLTGFAVMTTPAAWVDACRGIPSTLRAISMSSRT